MFCSRDSTNCPRYLCGDHPRYLNAGHLMVVLLMKDHLVMVFLVESHLTKAELLIGSLLLVHPLVLLVL